MASRNPGKPKHLRAARSKLESARGLYRSVREAGEGEAGFRQEVLLYAHATAAQAMQEAANAGALGLRDQAYRVQQQIESHLSQLRRPGETNPIENPSVRRFKDLPTARRDAARKAKRTDMAYFIYELSKNPRFAVMSADHPVQQSYQKGVIGLGKAKLRATVNPPAGNPYETKGKAQVGGLGLHKQDYTYRGYAIKVTQTRQGTWIADATAPGRPLIAQRDYVDDSAAAVERMRILVDRELYLDGLSDLDKERFLDMDATITLLVGSLGANELTRSHLARAIEEFRKGEVLEWAEECEQEENWPDDSDCMDTYNTLAGYEFFDSLPLSDRLRWLDSAIKMERLLVGLPLTNPRKRGAPRRNPDRSAFRRLMRL